jgi:Tfp pilus assembly protein PilO
MEKKKLETVVLTAVVAVIGAVIIYQFLPAGSPTGKREEAAVGEDYAGRLMRAERLVKILPEQKKLLSEQEQRLENLSAQIPPETDHTWLSRQINEISSEVGVEGVSQRYRPVESAQQRLSPDLKKIYAEKLWEIRMSCGYHELGEFLGRLEGGNGFLEVREIDIEGNDPGKQKIRLLISYIAGKEDQQK